MLLKEVFHVKATSLNTVEPRLSGLSGTADNILHNQESEKR